jgi:hypothetical protein
MRAPALLLSIALVALASCDERNAESPANEGSTTANQRTRAVIQTAQGEVALDLEVAASGAAQESGLSGRKSLAPRTGMLFPLDPPRTPNFWTKGTPIALDLIFVRSDGSIAAILPGKPDDGTPISTGEPARGVIEIGHGESARLGIKTGDIVRWGDCSATGGSDPLRFCPG